MIKFPKILNGAMAALGAAMMVSSAAAQDPPRLQTNETYVTEATTRSQTLAIDDPMAVFAYVLGSLPERVKVYPTENHYYFSFDLNGTRYAGNIKIDARLRAEGQVEFSYYEDRAAWLQDTEGTGLALGPSRGVTGGASRAAGLPGELRQEERRFCAQRPVTGQTPGGGAGSERSIHRSGVRRIGDQVFPRVQYQAEIIPL